MASQLLRLPPRRLLGALVCSNTGLGVNHAALQRRQRRLSDVEGRLCAQAGPQRLLLRCLCIPCRAHGMRQPPGSRLRLGGPLRAQRARLLHRLRHLLSLALSFGDPFAQLWQLSRHTLVRVLGGSCIRHRLRALVLGDTQGRVHSAPSLTHILQLTLQPAPLRHRQVLVPPRQGRRAVTATLARL